jgi:hypothetical protein
MLASGVAVVVVSAAACVAFGPQFELVGAAEPSPPPAPHRSTVVVETPGVPGPAGPPAVGGSNPVDDGLVTGDESADEDGMITDDG